MCVPEDQYIEIHAFKTGAVSILLCKFIIRRAGCQPPLVTNIHLDILFPLSQCIYIYIHMWSWVVFVLVVLVRVDAWCMRNEKAVAVVVDMAVVACKMKRRLS